MRKILSRFFGSLAGLSFVSGLILAASNIQGRRVPDGYPLDPWWLELGLLTVVPLVAIYLAVAIWPEENPVLPEKKFYQGESKHLLLP